MLNKWPQKILIKTFLFQSLNRNRSTMVCFASLIRLTASEGFSFFASQTSSLKIYILFNCMVLYPIRSGKKRVGACVYAGGAKID